MASESLPGLNEELNERESGTTCWDAEAMRYHVTHGNDEVEHVTASDAEPEKHVASTFVVEASPSQSQKSLQDAFLKYKKSRQKEIKQERRKRCEVPDEARLRAMADPERMRQLRLKFLEQTKKYFGVPYSRKYWKPEDPEYNSPFFLDCCGLVRRAMRDLKKDFGFKMGPWNQSYMCDTLPIAIDREEDMQPGDLVFISATYYNDKMKKQKHSLTHVEVWLGDGPKTIGARWHKGKVQVFDSYKFNSTSYHSMKYIFKSIDTWLMGICRREHPWRTRAEKFKPSKKSIFSLEPAADPDEEPDESAGDSSGEELVSQRSTDQPHKQQQEQPNKQQQQKKLPKQQQQQQQNLPKQQQQQKATKATSPRKVKKTIQAKSKRISKSAQPRLFRDDCGSSPQTTGLAGIPLGERKRPMTRARSQPQVLRGLGVQGHAFGQNGSKYDVGNSKPSSQQVFDEIDNMNDIPDDVEAQDDKQAGRISQDYPDEDEDLPQSTTYQIQAELSGFTQMCVSDDNFVEDSISSKGPECSGLVTQQFSSGAKISPWPNPPEAIGSDLGSRASLISSTTEVSSLSQDSSLHRGNVDDITSVAATEFIDDATKETDPNTVDHSGAATWCTKTHNVHQVNNDNDNNDDDVDDGN